jgi:hypothetical protein
VVFHNLKNYDTHHIFRHFSRCLAAKYDRKGRNSYDNVNIIALNLERYVSFKIRLLRFIDSYQFLSARMEKLVKNLTNNSFRHARKHLGCNDLLFVIGIFPYNWFDSFEKLDCAEVPPQDAFYSEINEDCITDEEYSRAQEVWTNFEC